MFETRINFALLLNFATRVHKNHIKWMKNCPQFNMKLQRENLSLL